MSRILLLLGLVLLPACDEWHLSINSDGLVFISIVDDGDELGDRFRIRISDDGGTSQLVNVPSSGQLNLPSMAAGRVQLTLMAPEGCQVVGANPQVVVVSERNETRVLFDVHCG